MTRHVKYVLLGLSSAAAAAWLKMLLPEFISTYSAAFSSVRNTLGLIVAAPLYELYKYWWAYLFSLWGFGVAEPMLRRQAPQKRFSLLFGLSVTTTMYAAYMGLWYLKAAMIYARHAAGASSKPWYKWIEWPVDAELLLVYALTGLFAGWLYHRWLIELRAVVQ